MLTETFIAPTAIPTESITEETERKSVHMQ